MPHQLEEEHRGVINEEKGEAGEELRPEAPPLKN